MAKKKFAVSYASSRKPDIPGYDLKEVRTTGLGIQEWVEYTIEIETLDEFLEVCSLVVSAIPQHHRGGIVLSYGDGHISCRPEDLKRLGCEAEIIGYDDYIE